MFNKNIKRTFCIVLLLVMMVLIFCGCTDPETGLSKKLVKQIKQTYLDAHKDENSALRTVDDVYILSYYGTYNGCVAVMMTGKGFGYADEEVQAVIADVAFYYGNANEIVIWKGNQFYEMKEAYENGWLTKENVQSIADKRHGHSN